MQKTLSGPSLRKYNFLLLICIFHFHSYSQELNFTVNINADIVQTTERAIFDEMKTAFERFLNETQWTEQDYLNNEKIKANLLLTIQDQPSIGQFRANAQIQVVRPVYNSTYETLLFNFADRDWEFQFTQSQPLQFNQNSFTNNITSLLAYYAYVALGLDHDSFSPLEGSPFYQTALNIVNNAQNGGGVGWGQFQNRRNRYWLIENLLSNSQYEPVRQALYQYHINGMDIFESNPDLARENILDALKKVTKVNSVLPNSILVISFLDAKSDEIVNVFSEGDNSIRRETYNELLKLDPSRRSQYQKIVQN